MSNDTALLLRAIERLHERMDELIPLPARLLTFEQSAEYMAMSIDTIRRMCDRRELTYVQARPGAAKRIPLDALQRWIDEHSRRPLAQ
jgi:excisionase family DNA binding protein